MKTDAENKGVPDGAPEEVLDQRINPVVIDAGDLFILRIAAQGFITQNPESPNVPSIRVAIEAAVTAQRSGERAKARMEERTFGL